MKGKGERERQWGEEEEEQENILLLGKKVHLSGHVLLQ